MRKDFSERKIPTLIGLLIIFIGIFGTSFLVRNLGPLSTRAGPSEIPQEVKITNITDNSLTVSWITQDEVAGSVVFWSDQANQQTAVDTRDKAGTAGLYKTHFVNLSTLAPATTYFFTLNSGKGSYNDNNSPYKATTSSAGGGAKIKLEGLVLNSDSSMIKEALVYAGFGKAFSFSSLASSGGEWTILVETQNQKTLGLLITDGQLNSTIKADFPINTLPAITLGQNYDFTTSEKPASPSPTKTSKFEVAPPTKTTTAPQILNPDEGEKFTDLQPRFSGTAPKGTTVKIKIESPSPLEGSVKTDSNGNWSYRPPTSLSSGAHTITITAPDNNGILHTITRQFQVFASGSQVAPPATPSATPTLKLSPTPTATPTATPTKTIAPTQIPIPTKAPQPIPVTATPLPSLVLGGFGILTFILGLVLLF